LFKKIELSACSNILSFDKDQTNPKGMNN